MAYLAISPQRVIVAMYTVTLWQSKAAPAAAAPQRTAAEEFFTKNGIYLHDAEEASGKPTMANCRYEALMPGYFVVTGRKKKDNECAASLSESDPATTTSELLHRHMEFNNDRLSLGDGVYWSDLDQSIQTVHAAVMAHLANAWSLGKEGVSVLDPAPEYEKPNINGCNYIVATPGTFASRSVAYVGTVRITTKPKEGTKGALSRIYIVICEPEDGGQNRPVFCIWSAHKCRYQRMDFPADETAKIGDPTFDTRDPPSGHLCVSRLHSSTRNEMIMKAALGILFGQIAVTVMQHFDGFKDNGPIRFDNQCNNLQTYIYWFTGSPGHSSADADKRRAAVVVSWLRSVYYDKPPAGMASLLGATSFSTLVGMTIGEANKDLAPYGLSRERGDDAVGASNSPYVSLLDAYRLRSRYKAKP